MRWVLCGTYGSFVRIGFLGGEWRVSARSGRGSKPKDSPKRPLAAIVSFLANGRFDWMDVKAKSNLWPFDLLHGDRIPLADHSSRKLY